MTTPLYRNGWIRIGMSFVIMALAFGVPNIYMAAVQFIAGILYFCLGLKLVLDARNP